MRRLSLTYVSRPLRHTQTPLFHFSVETLRRTENIYIFTNDSRLRPLRRAVRRWGVETRLVSVCLKSQIEALRRITPRRRNTPEVPRNRPVRAYMRLGTNT